MKNLLNARRVRERYDICERTLHRWERQLDLGFPKALVVNRRKYFHEDELDEGSAVAHAYRSPPNDRLNSLTFTREVLPCTTDTTETKNPKFSIFVWSYKMDKLMPINLLFDLIDEQPLEGAKEARKRGKGVRLLNWETGASGYALAKRIVNEPNLLSAFYSQELWDGGYEKDPTHLLRHCCQFVLGAREGSDAKRAENWAAAMQPTFDETTTSPEKLLDTLKKGGFDGLRRAAAPLLPAAPLRPKAAKLSIEKDHKKSGSGKEEGPPKVTPSTEVVGTAKPRHPKLTVKEVFEHLLVAMKPEELDRFLADASEAGDTFRLTIQRDPDNESGMLVWRAIHIGKVLNAD